MSDPDRLAHDAGFETGLLQIGRLRIHQTVGGQGSPVVMIHGLGSSGYIEWRLNLPVLARSHRVLAPDLPGFGRSSKPRARYGIPLFTRVIDQYMQAHGLDSAAVVGTSMGGRVALELALRHPERVRRLVLVNALGLGRPSIQPWYAGVSVPGMGEAALRLMREGLRHGSDRAIRQVAARAVGMTADPERTLDRQYLADMREMHGAQGYPEAYLATVRSLVTLAALQGAHDLVPQLHRIRVPVLFVWGADDPLFPLAHATRAHAALPGSRLAVIEGAGHTPQAERPDEFNRVVTSFLLD